MAESFGVETRGRFYDPVGALRDVHAEPPAAPLPWRWNHPRAATMSSVSDRERDVFAAMPAASRADYRRGRSTAIGRSTASPTTRRDRDLRRAETRDRQLALGRRALLHPRWQGAAARSVSPSALPRVLRAHRSGRAEPTGFLIDPHAEALLHPTRDPPRGNGPTRSIDVGRRDSRQARSPPRTRRCCTPRWSVTARISPAKTQSNRRSASSRCCPTHRPVEPYPQHSWGQRHGLISALRRMALALAAGPPARLTPGRDVEAQTEPTTERFASPVAPLLGCTR